MSSNPQNPAPPLRTAKLFKNGRSQAVRLPKEFRFPGTEVYIRQNPTGEITLTPKPVEQSTHAPTTALAQSPTQNLSGEELIRIFDQTDFPEDFFVRDLSMPRELDIFNEPDLDRK